MTVKSNGRNQILFTHRFRTDGRDVMKLSVNDLEGATKRREATQFYRLSVRVGALLAPLMRAINNIPFAYRMLHVHFERCE